jgi:hypothetical protein
MGVTFIVKNGFLYFDLPFVFLEICVGTTKPSTV